MPKEGSFIIYLFFLPKEGIYIANHQWHLAISDNSKKRSTIDCEEEAGSSTLKRTKANMQKLYLAKLLNFMLFING